MVSADSPHRQTRFRVRFARTKQDIDAVQRLRHRCFQGGGLCAGEGVDADRFDAHCDHIMIEDSDHGHIVACCRVLALSSGSEIGQSYSAQYYELSALQRYPSPMVEVGRFCIAPECSEPDVLRLAWGALTRFVDDHGAQMLFGCSSFRGTTGDDYADAFALLAARHIAPRRWRPRVKASSVLRFAETFRRKPDRRRALLKMPPLLKSYLHMGGWVSDHAVVDRDLGTLHVFTGLEVRAIPPLRRRRLRALSS